MREMCGSDFEEFVWTLLDQQLRHLPGKPGEARVTATVTLAKVIPPNCFKLFAFTTH